MANRRPNILCFITDQQRADHLGCAGNPVLHTPVLDRLAASGVRLERAYASNPLCMPVRATLFTGLTPRGHGVRTNGIPLRRDLPTLAGALAAAGYRTHAAGKLHLTPWWPQHGQDPATLNEGAFAECGALWASGQIRGLPAPYYGFQGIDLAGGHGDYFWGDYAAWLETEHPGALSLYQPGAALRPRTGADQSWVSAMPAAWHHSTWIAGRAIDFLRRQAAGDAPFFLWCSFPDPHHPFCPPEPYAARYDPASIPLPPRRAGELDDLPPHFRASYEGDVQVSGRQKRMQMPPEHLREIIAHTYGMVALLDEQIGRVLAALDELGLQRDTIVVFLSDHGDLLGDHGLINKGPFHLEGLLRVPMIWSWPGHFAPGATSAALVSSIDFAPTVLDLCGVPVPEGPLPPRVEAPQQLPPWPGRSLAPVLRGEVQGIHEAVLVENDEDYLGLRLRTLVTPRIKLTAYPGQPYGELFDLQEDPHELHNRWSDPAYARLRDELRLQLLDELVRTDSALPRRLSHA
jgi:arylsulfatase A-like enzyme